MYKKNNQLIFVYFDKNRDFEVRTLLFDLNNTYSVGTS